jgi:hypothetical protein
MDFINLGKKIREPVVFGLLPFVIATKQNQTLRYGYKNLWKIFRLDCGFLFLVMSIFGSPTYLYCYPNTGVTAALELALVSKDLTNMEKLDFVRRKVEFMQEFGDVGRSVNS